MVSSRIFKLGSCRMNNLLPNLINNYTYTHTSKEVIQWLDIYENKICIENVPFIDLIIPQKDKFNLNKFKQIYNNCDTLLIEISSSKLVTYKQFYYNLNYYSRELQNNNPTLKELIKINIQSEDELYNDLLFIKQRLSSKKVIFVGHLLMDFYDLPNFNPIHRRQIDNVLRRINNDVIILYDLFKNENYKDIFDNDVNHFKESSKKRIAEHFSNLL